MYFNSKVLELVQKLNREAGEIAYFSYVNDGYSEYIKFLNETIVWINKDDDEMLNIKEIESQLRGDVKRYLNQISIELSHLIK